MFPGGRRFVDRTANVWAVELCMLEVARRVSRGGVLAGETVAGIYRAIVQYGRATPDRPVWDGVAEVCTGGVARGTNHDPRRRETNAVFLSRERRGAGVGGTALSGAR